MAMAGRPPGQVKTGGRKKGTLNKERRKEITDEIAHDILTVYRGLGGVSFLLDFAKAQPTEFVRNCLARLMPPMPRDDPDVQLNQQINVGNMTDFEAAQRIAFALAKGLHSQIAEPAIEAERLPREPDLPTLDQTPQIDPERAQWASALSLTDEQRRDQAAVRETHTATLENYAGSAAEQGLAQRRQLL